MHTDRDTASAVPHWLLRVISALERHSGRIPPVLAMGLIGTVGTAVTGALALYGIRATWLVALAGTVVTLTLMHAYLMLISTRMRARDLAREMSAALVASEARSRAIMDAAPDAVISVDAQGAVRWGNQATRSIFGHETEALAGQPLDVILPALAIGPLEQFFAEHGIGHRVIGYETEGRRVDGTMFPVAVSASHANLDGERWYTFIMRDTTDAKWSEQELLLRDRALSSSANGIVIVDMRLPNQPMIYVNQAFERITGYEAYEVLGVNCRLLQGTDVEQPQVQQMRDAIRERRGCHVVLRNYRKDGTMFWNDLAISPVVQPDGTVTHYVGVQTDITERVAAEEVLRLRTERLNAVFDLSPDGFVAVDEGNAVSIVNRAFERLTGLSADELIGRPSDELEQRLMSRCAQHESLEAEADADDTRSALGSGVGPGSAAIAARDMLHLHSPTLRTLLRRTRHGGHGNETVMYLRDITHELEVDRMKSEFLSMAAHELRTPMASIFGFTELLLKRKFDDERRQDMLATIHRQAGLLINLVNELLDLARIEARRGKDFKRKVVPLRPMVENTVAGLLIHNDPRRVELSLPDEVIWVDVDVEKLSLAVTNVVSNAYKYSPRGGAVELGLAWRERDGQRECGVRVTDHGIGMTPEQQSRVFERFFRADTSGNIPGTGLGMTIVKEIVELHGGQVQINSELGQGTVVTIWLPVVDAPVEGSPLPLDGHGNAQPTVQTTGLAHAA